MEKLKKYKEMTEKPEKNNTMRNVVIIVVAGILINVILGILDIPGRVSGNTQNIENIDATKMDKADAESYFNRLETLLSTQSATWNQYMISNEKDKERIFRDIERIQDDVKDLNRNYQAKRSANSQ